MIDKILQVTKKELNEIDYSNYYKTIMSISNYQGYFFLESGKEHYRLISYISTLYNNRTLIDIGTYQGFSALALGYNGQNAVKSYDIKKEKEVDLISKDISLTNNISFYIENVLDDLNTLLSSPFIVLDTAHDGIFEEKVIRCLIDNNWNGILLMDDINEYAALSYIWKSLKKEKYDLTYKGHWSGTGIAVFN
jgi:hypothetical protein